MVRPLVSVRIKPEVLDYIKKNIARITGRTVASITDYEAAKKATEHYYHCSVVAESTVFAENGKKFYNVSEVAVMLGKPTRTIRSWCKQGKLKATKFSGTWLISKRAIDDLVNEKFQLPKVEVVDRPMNNY